MHTYTRMHTHAHTFRHVYTLTHAHTHENKKELKVCGDHIMAHVDSLNYFLYFYICLVFCINTKLLLLLLIKLLAQGQEPTNDIIATQKGTSEVCLKSEARVQ